MGDTTQDLQLQQARAMKDFALSLAEIVAQALNCAIDQIQYERVAKNNGVLKDALICRSDADHSAAPTIYLQGFYQQYVEGREMKDIATEIAANVQQTKNHTFSFNAEEMKQNVFGVVVNAASNAELLKEVPHRLIAGGELAVIPRVKVSLDGDTGTYIVRNSMLSMPGVEMTRDEIIDLAIAHTNHEDYSFRGMSQVLAGLMGGGEDADAMMAEMFPSEREMMYVFSAGDASGAYGARAILNKTALQEIHDKVGDFFVLPSSVHEVIILPKASGFDVESLNDLIQSVNQAEVDAEEVLGGKALVFDGHKLTLASDAVTDSHTQTRTTQMSM